jgi:undecaprenyl-phosphate 4-deoxy-4-formamido-L-arabinose transferase
LPNTERIARETVTLPLFPAMTCADVERVCTTVGEVLAGGEGFEMSAPLLSVIIPVYNEAGYPAGAVCAALSGAGRAGRELRSAIHQRRQPRSSAALLKDQFLARPDVTRVILFNANCGQHMAIMAGFEYCRGERVVTLDADLQNPPEEIGKLLAAMDRGHDYVGSIRAELREDSCGGMSLHG